MISESRKLYTREYRKTNREKLNSYQRKYYREKRYILPCYTNRRKTPIDSDTSSLGRKYELFALELLRGSKDMNNDKFHGGYDLEWDNKRIEVKMRNKNKNGNWLFTFKKGCTATHALLFCVDGGIHKVLLMPYQHKDIYVTAERYKEYEIVFSSGGLS